MRKYCLVSGGVVWLDWMEVLSREVREDNMRLAEVHNVEETRGQA